MDRFDSSIELVVRSFGALVFSYLAWSWIHSPADGETALEYLDIVESRFLITFVVASAALAFVLSPYPTVRMYRWARSQLESLLPYELLGGAIGLALGLMVAWLLAPFVPFSALDKLVLPLSVLDSEWPLGKPISLFGALFGGFDRFAAWCFPLLLGSFGAMAFASQPRLIRRLVRAAAARQGGEYRRYVLDFSGLVDGRVVALVQAGVLGRDVVLSATATRRMVEMMDSSAPDEVATGTSATTTLGRLRMVPGTRISEYVERGAIDPAPVFIAKKLGLPLVTGSAATADAAARVGVRCFCVANLDNGGKVAIPNPSRRLFPSRPAGIKEIARVLGGEGDPNSAFGLPLGGDGTTGLGVRPALRPPFPSAELPVSGSLGDQHEHSRESRSRRLRPARSGRRAHR